MLLSAHAQLCLSREAPIYEKYLAESMHHGMLMAVAPVAAVILNYFLDQGLNKPQIVFPGLGCAVIAIALGTLAHRDVHNHPPAPQHDAEGAGTPAGRCSRVWQCLCAAHSSA